MVIGISGKINSAKDTVGRIIQCLTHGDRPEKIEEIVTNNWLPINEDCTFQIKKFADKLKDIVCILIGCTREQLEDREFKEKELGPEWDKFIKIQTETGKKIGSWFNSYEECSKTIRDSRKFMIGTFAMTPRLLLQLLGTECGRQILHPNLWVLSLMKDYDKRVGNTTYCTYCYGENYVIGNIPSWKCPKHPNMPTAYIPPASKPNWIITDMRFPNELKAIKDRKGITIRVNRPILIKTDAGNITISVEEAIKDGIMAPEHESETALDNAEFDHVIDNDGTIEELIQKVKDILIIENIIQ